MNLKVFENWLGERIYDTNNHLGLTVETEIKKNNKLMIFIRKQENTNTRDSQKNIIEVLQLPLKRKKTEVLNSRVTKSSYETELPKMRSHFELLTPKYL